MSGYYGGNNRDSGWKARNSLHLILFLFPYCFPWPFVVMASKAESKKFRRLGLAYFIAGLALFIMFFLSFAAESEDMGVVSMLLGIVVHIFAIVQCLMYMGEYHRLLAERENMIRMGINPYSNPYNNQYNNMYNNNMYGQNFGGYNMPNNVQSRIPMDNRSSVQMPNGGMPQFGRDPSQVNLSKQPSVSYGASVMGGGMQNAANNAVNGMQMMNPQPMQGAFGAANGMQSSSSGGQLINTQTQGKMNINTCSEEELASLPGLNIIDAKKAISHRQQYGDFGSIEELVVLLGLKPHIAAPLYDILYCEGSGAPQRAGSDSHNSGRRTLDF